MPDDHPVFVQPLSARLAGLPLDETLFDGVPPHLLTPLRSWVFDFLDEKLAHRVAAVLRLPLDPKISFASTGPGELAELTGTDLLDVIDLALQLDETMHFEVGVVGIEDDSAYSWSPTSFRAWAVARLAQLLRDGGSTYTVHWRVPLRLVHRVDPTITAAAEHATAVADPTTAELLADAWRQVHGRHPNPTTAYRQAVRAVEQVACPLVLPNNPKASLGTVHDHLRNASGKWTFVLVDKDEVGTVEPLVAILGRLWTGQVSRHGGGRNSRDQTQAEAETAVHLAAVLIQWLSSGALRRVR